MFSIKMRASKAKKHISGTEHLVDEKDVESSVQKSVSRAIHHSRGCPDEINIKLERIDKSQIIDIPSLSLITVKSANDTIGKKIIKKTLINKIPEITQFNFLEQYLYTDSHYIKGAKFFDINDVNYIHSHQQEDVRVTNLDLSVDVINGLKDKIEQYEPFNFKTADGLAIASKVCFCHGVLAEICMSDDPNYQGGYIAFPDIGYIRINKMKPLGSTTGGRIIIIDSRKAEIIAIKEFLEKTITLISTVPSVSKINYIDSSNINEFVAITLKK
ncbi:hypothetical protein IU970_004207 [Salmonella enterica subsp. enterica serovar Sandiego]|nr:hypothetical protein [Salmonella enterica subsp. enterica serovar Sandiego]